MLTHDFWFRLLFEIYYDMFPRYTVQYATDVHILLFLLEFLCKTGRVIHYFQYKVVAFFYVFPEISVSNS